MAAYVAERPVAEYDTLKQGLWPKQMQKSLWPNMLWPVADYPEQVVCWLLACYSEIGLLLVFLVELLRVLVCLVGLLLLLVC